MFFLRVSQATRPYLQSYIMALAQRDLQYRGFRDHRVLSFEYKQEALYLLFGRVRRCADDHEFELYRQSWDSLEYASYQPKDWHPKQKEVLARIKERTTIDDEEVKKTSTRFFVCEGQAWKWQDGRINRRCGPRSEGWPDGLDCMPYRCSCVLFKGVAS